MTDARLLTEEELEHTRMVAYHGVNPPGGAVVRALLEHIDALTEEREADQERIAGLERDFDRVKAAHDQQRDRADRLAWADDCPDCKTLRRSAELDPTAPKSDPGAPS